MVKRGHTDKLLIVDAGLAIPNGTKVIAAILSID
jgi:D-ribose pyranose/furanose isomerase RbsD